MSLNSFTVKKYLLTAGLLLVLCQGVWQLPELQDYLFPDKSVDSILRLARRSCPKIEDNLLTLNERINYLKWFRAHNGPDQKVSAERLLAFPFSESIRPLAPRYFWYINIFLAHKDRMRAESRLRYLEVAFKSMLSEDFRGRPSLASPAISAKMATVSRSMKQIKQFQNQFIEYNAKLMELTKQLAGIEANGYKK
jgi:hypothetical protein